MKKGKAYIGTSGWSYKHWRGTYYPEVLKNSEHFKYFAKRIPTVEINSSFYHLPKEETFEHWRDNAPVRFLFSVKASRYITHMKKLKTDDDSLEVFLDRALLLKKKLGPILFQLPPGWKINLERLEDFLNQLPSGLRYTFEFRNKTWLCDEVYDLLREHNCALCLFELEHFTTPLIETADYVYIRLHGPGNKYQGRYTNRELKVWSKRIQKWMNDGLDVYVYFDNDQEGYAALNAEELMALVQSE